MSAKDYLIKQGFDKTYWGKVIIAAEERGWFTQGERVEAGGWHCCACGKLAEHPAIARGVGNKPFDSALVVRGVCFYLDVDVDDFHAAAITLVEIERRTAQLITEWEAQS